MYSNHCFFTSSNDGREQMSLNQRTTFGRAVSSFRISMWRIRPRDEPNIRWAMSAKVNSC